MKLPPSLEKKRDELADMYERNHMSRDNEHWWVYGELIELAFQHGFDEAYELMKAREDLAIEALKKIENECACPTPEKCYDYAVEAITTLQADAEVGE